MRRRHFTKSDIKEMKIIDHDKEKNISREAIAMVGRYCIRSYGLKEIYIKKYKSLEPEEKYLIENVPQKFAVVAEIVDKKAVGHGGCRPGAGRKKSGKEVKKTRSIRMTEKEYAAVCKLLDDMRIHESK